MLTATILGGCSMANRKNVGGEPIEAELNLAKGKGDAFLYDAKIYRDGRKNSVRLDVYLYGDSLSVFARGYLGKGVLKGLIRGDSVIAYFPTENQYFAGKLTDILKGSCVEKTPLEKLLVDLFIKTPVKTEYLRDDFYLTIVKESRDELQYRLTASGCPEHIDLQYELRDRRYLLEKVEYISPDESFQFRAERRRQKLDVDIPIEKKAVVIPDSATRIYP